MNIENLSTLKIHKLTKAQYERELEAGRIDPNALYLTPDEMSQNEKEVYVQNDEPTDAPEGAIWVDLDDEGIASAQIQHDWNQNDPSAPDYIKNRTHYDGEVDIETTLFLGNLKSTDTSVIENLYRQRKTAKYKQSGTDMTYSNDEEGTRNYFVSGDGKTFKIYITDDGLIGAENVDTGSNPGLYVTYLEKGTEVHKLDPKYLPDDVMVKKPLLLDANLSYYYGGHAEAGDEALEAIKTGRQILVRVPNASGDNYVANYSPIYMYQVPQDGMYLYLFYLRDEKQDLSALLGQPAGTVLMPIYGEFMMLLSKKYDSNPLES